MSRERRVDAICALALVAFSTLLFADVLFLGSNFYLRDLFQYHMPLKRVVVDVISRGELPLWNGMIGGGQPMAANPAYEVFYPPQWLLFAGSFPFGWALHIVAHVWLALVGMYAMLRSLPLRVPASLFGALSFGLSGLMMGAITNLPTFFVWSWAPLIGLTLLRLVRAPDARRFAAAAVVAAMPLLVAEPFALLQVWLMVVVVAVAYARRRMAWVLGAGAASAVVAAVQLVPMLGLLRVSSRARGFSYALVTDWSMPPVRPLELILPRVFGVLVADGHTYWGGHLWPARGGPYLLSIYAGVAVVILAAAGFAARVPGARVTSALAIASYALAIGGQTPLFAWLYALGLRSLRYPEKFAAMGVVALIVFAATVADRLDDHAPLRRAACIAAWSVAALLLGWASVTLLPPFDRWFAAMWHLPPGRAPLAGLARWTALLSALVATGWAAAVTAHARGHRRPALLAALLLLLIDLGTLQNEAVQRMPRSFFQPPPMVAVFAPEATIFHRGEWTQQAEAKRFASVSPGWAARNALSPYTPALWGLRTVLEADYDETALLVTHNLLDAMLRLGREGFPRWSEPFMAVSNVAYVLDYRSSDAAMREVNGDVEISRPVRIRRVPNQGRYWFARGIVPARTQDELLAAFRRIEDVRGLAFVPWAPFLPAAGRVVRVNETANDCAVDVETAGRALLVVTVTRDRHWRATVDGAPAAIVPANVAYQAVVVPAGRHRVELHYRDGSIAAGAALSALALLALVTASITRRG